MTNIKKNLPDSKLPQSMRLKSRRPTHMLLSKFLHVAYCTRTINTPLSSAPALSNWVVLTQKNIPVGSLWAEVPCPAWRAGHNVKFFPVEAGVV